MPATFKALSGALARAGVRELADSPAVTLDTCVDADGTHHAAYKCPAAKGLTAAPVPLVLLLTGEASVCGACEGRLAAAKAYRWGYAGSLGAALYELFASSQAAAAAHRFVDNPARTTAAGKATKLADSVRIHQRQLGQVLVGTDAVLAAHRARILEELAVAADRLERAATGDDAQARVAARVHAQMTPKRYGHLVRLDATPVLVGVLGGRGASREVQEVLDTFQVAALPNGSLLRCPRFVYDYLNRFTEQGKDWATLLQAVPDDGLSESDIAAVAAVWDRTGATEMVNLAVAVAMVRTAQAS